MAEISTLAQTLLLRGLSRAVATDIELDEASGLYVREVRVWTRVGEEADAAEVLFFTLRLEGETRASVELTAPAQAF